MLFLTGSFLAGPAFAQLHSYGGNYSLESLMKGIAQATWIAFTVIALLMFVLAGITFLTAQGDSTKLQTARSAVIWGVVGVIVGIAAFGIITLVTGIIT